MNRRSVLSVFAYAAVAFQFSVLALADEASTTKRFEHAKASEPQLIAFVKNMPKGADLHNHVSGAVYGETRLDAAIKSDLFFDPTTCNFSREQTPGSVPAKELLTNNALAAKYLDTTSMRSWRSANESGHDHFFDTFYHMSVPLSLSDSLTEVLSRAKAQNVQYMELMANPVPSDAMNAALADPPNVDDLEKALAQMQTRFPAMIAAAKTNMDSLDSQLSDLVGTKAPITGVAGPINFRYIFSVSRTVANPNFFAQMACGLALVQADKRVVSVNILAPEDDTMARTNFDTQMRIIDFLWNRMGKPDLTLHAGELTLAISPVEVMRSRIRKTIEIGHARRIGHGVSIAWEDNLPGLLAEMKQKRIAIEICLTSNDSILGISGNRHPFSLYQEAGIPMILNTDDEGVSRGNLTMEFVRAIRTYNLSYNDVKLLARNSIEYSFLPGASLYVNGDYLKLVPELADVRNPGWTPSARCMELMNASDKLTEEVTLERAFVEFEK
ncbi:MAG: hypothetical protein ABFD49_03010 [Armatimonadota bacterium]|nr:hypothetical protein [bacterium]